MIFVPKAPATPFAMDLTDLTFPSLQEMRWAPQHRGARLPQHVHLSGPMCNVMYAESGKIVSFSQRMNKPERTVLQSTWQVHYGALNYLLNKFNVIESQNRINFISQLLTCWNFLASSWLRFRGFLPCFNCLWEMRFSPSPGSSREGWDVKTQGCQEWPRRSAVSL